jgi:hypothetical protein
MYGYLGMENKADGNYKCIRGIIPTRSTQKNRVHIFQRRKPLEMFTIVVIAVVKSCRFKDLLPT